jgi:hypothetical protein
MAPTTDIRDCARFAAAITAVGGTVPDALGHLLSAYELLSRPGPQEPPERDILTHALNGTLDEKTLSKLLPAAAAAHAANIYRQELARNSEHVLLGAWHRAVKAGAADQILDSVRDRLQASAEAIAKARSMIDPESSPEHILASAAPEMIAAWQGLDGHLRVIGAIAAVARQFGPSLGSFPQITEYPLGENARLVDSAIMCCDGPSLEVDSAPFHKPDQGHRTSPWFKVPLRLHSIESARARYSRWAAGQWDAQHSGPQGGWIDQDGRMHEHPRPANPYRQKAST